MLPRLQTIWQNIRSSLWALPLLMVFIASAAAVLAVRVKFGTGGSSVWFLYSGDAQDAPLFLSHLVSSMITMATLAISITMVVLTLAAQQLGPRMIRSFMSDWRTQAALGLFASTVVYLLLVLRTTYGASSEAPNLAVTIGTGLVLVSLLTLLLFVHHLASSIVADNVVQRIGTELDEQIDRLLPAKDAESEASNGEHFIGRGGAVRLTTGGYVQAIDIDRLVHTACEADAVVEWLLRPGDHAVARTVAGWVRPPTAAAPEVCDALVKAVLIGNERTSIQDLEFSIRQLVEIAVRALSPGINDPFTAIAVIDRLGRGVGRAMEHGQAPSLHRDKDGSVRLVVRAPNFEGLTDAAFNQIRQNAATMPAVLIRLAEVLVQLVGLADDSQRVAIEKHMRMVLNAGRTNFAEAEDLRALAERIEPSLGA